MSTSTKQITELKNKHKGQDIYVLASGASLDFVPKQFFKNKVCIGVNRVVKFFECDYVVCKDSVGFEGIIRDAIGSPIPLIAKYETGDPGRMLNSLEDAYIFDHFDKPNQRPKVELISKNIDKMVVSYSTITTAIHLAAYLGATNIIIVGHDCGVLDGRSAIKGYHEDQPPVQRSEAGYISFLSSIEDHTILVKQKVQQVYGCSVMSLNPFINFSLEGHKFRKA